MSQAAKIVTQLLAEGSESDNTKGIRLFNQALEIMLDVFYENNAIRMYFVPDTDKYDVYKNKVNSLPPEKKQEWMRMEAEMRELYATDSVFRDYLLGKVTKQDLARHWGRELGSQ